MNPSRKNPLTAINTFLPTLLVNNVMALFLFLVCFIAIN
jgi:hypothetical protein